MKRSWLVVALLAVAPAGELGPGPATLLAAGLSGNEKDPPPAGSAAAAARFAVAKSLSEREDWSEAVAKFREFRREHPEDPRGREARFWTGYCLVKSEEFDGAVEELAPFRTELAADTWADDALLQLGHAYRGLEDDSHALEVWNELVQKHGDSVWRAEATMQIIDVLFDDRKDYAACLPYCQRMVEQAADFSGIAEVHYAGAYCCIALGRYAEADRWMDRWFRPDDAEAAGWRRILEALRALRSGRSEAALRSIEALDADFPDLDRSDRLDLTLRAAAMLAREHQSGRSRDLLIATLRKSLGDSEDELAGLLDQLEDALPDDGAFGEMLAKLAGEPALPLMARVVVRERRVQDLRGDDHADKGEQLLRAALAAETSEFPLCRAARLLAELKRDDQDDPPGALKVLKDILPRLHRPDLIYQVREEIQELEKSANE